jgi:hypothetical protein
VSDRGPGSASLLPGKHLDVVGVSPCEMASTAAQPMIQAPEAGAELHLRSIDSPTVPGPAHIDPESLSVTSAVTGAQWPGMHSSSTQSPRGGGGDRLIPPWERRFRDARLRSGISDSASRARL